jgi:heat shock protein HtpX
MRRSPSPKGLIDLLPADELDAVIAHELTHVRNRDTLTQAVAGTLAGSLTYLGRILTLGALYFPVASGWAARQQPPGDLCFCWWLARWQPGCSAWRSRAPASTLPMPGPPRSPRIPLALVRALETLEAHGAKGADPR